MVQKTDYPWKGAIAITVNPEQTRTFSVYIRVPNRNTSKLYTETPPISGLKHFSINGEQVTPHIEKGYAVVRREWKAGDRIELELPMEPQRVAADDRVKADLGTVALKYGPLVYNLKTADQQDLEQQLSDAPLKVEWKPDLLGGVMVITGTWKNGSPMIAIPNYARMNRVGPPHEYPGDVDINYAPGATTSAETRAPGSVRAAAPATPVIVTPTAGAGDTAPVNSRRNGRAIKVQSKFGFRSATAYW